MPLFTPTLVQKYTLTQKNDLFFSVSNPASTVRHFRQNSCGHERFLATAVFFEDQAFLGSGFRTSVEKITNQVTIVILERK
jgi:hypothetical protein